MGTKADPQDIRVHRQRPHFAAVPYWLLDAGINDRALRLYIVLGRWADHGTGDLKATVANLAKSMGCSESTMHRALRDLVKVGGLVAAEGFGKNGRQTSNRYTLMWDPPGVTDDTPTAVPPVTPPVLQKDQHDQEPSVLGREVAIPDTPKPRARRAQDVAFDAIVEATGADPDVEGGRVAKALSTIRKAFERDRGSPLPGKLGEDDAGWASLGHEIRRRAVLYEDRWPEIDLTPTGLAMNWTRVTKPQAQSRFISPTAVMEKLRAQQVEFENDPAVIEGELLGEEG